MARCGIAVALLCLVAVAAVWAQDEDGRTGSAPAPGAFNFNENYLFPLDTKNFNELTRNYEIAIVLFVNPNHPQSTRLVQQYQRVGYELQRMVPCGLVNNVESPEIARAFQVSDYPRFFVFRDALPREYLGERTAPAIVSYLSKLLREPAFLKVDSKKSKQAFASNDDLKAIAFFDDLNSKEAKEFIKFAKVFQNTISSAITTSKEFAKSFGLTAAPSAVIFPPLEEPVHFEGKMDVTKLIPWGHEHRSTLITEISSSNLFGLSGSPNATAVILFIDESKECKDQLTLYRSVAKGMGRNSQVTFLYVRQSEFPEFVGRYGLDSATDLPAIAGFWENMEAHAFASRGKKMDVPKLKHWLKDVMAGKVKPHIKSAEPVADQSGPVRVIARSEFSHYVLQAPNAVAVLFHKGTENAAMHSAFTAAAPGLLGKCDFVTFDLTTNDPDAMVEKYTKNPPAVLIFPTLAKGHPTVYEGAATSAAITEFATKHLTK